MRKAERLDIAGVCVDRDEPVALQAVTPPQAVVTLRRVPEAPEGAAAGDPNAEADGDLGLSQQSVWYRLMKLTNLINRPFFSRYAERYHLTINDARVLVTLACLPEAAAHRLCDATGMHPMNVSRSVATLRRQGRIAERRDPGNRRRKMLRLTPKGRAACRSFVPDMDRMSSFLLSSMSAREVEFLSRLVDLLIERLETVESRSSMPPRALRAG